MYGQETITPYGVGKGKAPEVEQMFDGISGTYDKLNHLLSLSIDRRWRKKALGLLARERPKKMLDVATGTGDLAIMAAKRLRPDSIVGIDISEGMMAVGRRKIEAKGLGHIINMYKDDCMNLSFGDDTFDAVTVAFGIRNFPDLEKGLGEMFRVLRKGGALAMAELTRPLGIPMRQLFWLYSHAALPLAGMLVARDRKAYNYLISTIEAFPQGEEMEEILRRKGFREVSFRRLTGGICTIYKAIK